MDSKIREPRSLPASVTFEVRRRVPRQDAADWSEHDALMAADQIADAFGLKRTRGDVQAYALALWRERAGWSAAVLATGAP